MVAGRIGAEPRVQLFGYARWNTASFVALIYLIEICWLAASRFLAEFSDYEAYRIIELDLASVAIMVSVAVAYSVIGVFGAYIAAPIPRISIRRLWLNSFVLLACLSKIVSFFVISQGARYTSGGLTGVAGMVYSVSAALALGAMIVVVRQRLSNNMQTPIWLVVALIACFAINIDGLAGALTLATFCFLMLKPATINKPLYLFLGIVAMVLVLWAGLTAKYPNGLPDYFTPSFMATWVVARFAIQAEQMYTYVTGNSIIGNLIGYYDLLLRMNLDRIDIIIGRGVILEYPRSINEAIYFDMSGDFGSGSSSGILLGTYMMGALGVVVPVVMSFVFFQLFWGSASKLSFARLLALSFLFKQIYANISEYQVLVSPSLLYLFVFIASCLVTAAPLEQGGRPEFTKPRGTRRLALRPTEPTSG